jgi:hypothetical protein
MHLEELIRKQVSNHDAGLEGDDAGVLLGLVPNVDASSST